MPSSRRKPPLIGVIGLMCLALSGTPALAEGADAAQPQDQQNNRRRAQQQVQQPRERDANRGEDRNRGEQWRERRAADERARAEQLVRERQAAEERARERRLTEERRRDGDRRRDRNNDGGAGFRWRDRDRDGIPDHRDRDRDGDGVPNWRDRHPDSPRWSDRRWHGPSHGSPYRRHAWVDHYRFDVRPDRRRVYRNTVILRPYGPWYYGYGRYYRDLDAYPWLGLTAITLGILTYLNEAQLRAHEDAQIAATTAAIGMPIAWHDGIAHGTAVATRDGWSDTGSYCREFQQTVSIGGRTEQAYGTACLQPDGSWQVTS
ncbi:MAG: hypothetical protein FJX60_07470 [Alphaproteobacteria bacterium]|nr:hypothetical protein [Alphaproteobacteria bacterium]